MQYMSMMKLNVFVVNAQPHHKMKESLKLSTKFSGRSFHWLNDELVLMNLMSVEIISMVFRLTDDVYRLISCVKQTHRSVLWSGF